MKVWAELVAAGQAGKSTQGQGERDDTDKCCILPAVAMYHRYFTYFALLG